MRHKSSPIPTGGLEILITMVVKIQSDREEPCGNGDLEEFGAAGDFEASQQIEAEVEVLDPLEGIKCID